MGVGFGVGVGNGVGVAVGVGIGVGVGLGEGVGVGVGLGVGVRRVKGEPSSLVPGLKLRDSLPVTVECNERGPVTSGVRVSD